jgi:hypothetical protein
MSFEVGMNPRTHDDIAKRAYAIWEREGQPDGRDAEHWRMAEEQLAQEGDGGTPPRSPAPRRPTLVRSRPRKSGT